MIQLGYNYFITQLFPALTISVLPFEIPPILFLFWFSISLLSGTTRFSRLILILSAPVLKGILVPFIEE